VLFIQALNHEYYDKTEAQLQAFLISTLDGWMVSVSPKPLQSGGKSLRFHYQRVEGWAIPQPHTERSGKYPSIRICKGSRHSRPARSQVIVLTELSRLTYECRAYTNVTTKLQYNHPAHSYLQERQTLTVATQTITVRIQTLVWIRFFMCQK